MPMRTAIDRIFRKPLLGFVAGCLILATTHPVFGQDTLKDVELGMEVIHSDEVTTSSGTAGWRESPWFGWLNTTADPFHFHLNHGWLFIPDTSTNEDLFYFDAQHGWLYTNKQLYPNIFTFSDSDWLRYAPGSSRWFRHNRTREWKQYPKN